MIAVLGSPIFRKKLVNQLQAKNIDAAIITKSIRDKNFKKEIEPHKIVHFISSPTVSIVGILYLVRLRLWKKKILVTWIGTDTLIAIKNPIFKLLTKFCQFMIDKNLAVSSNLVEELKKIGIDSAVQHFPFFTLQPLQQLPNDKKIAVYLPDNKEKMWKLYQGNIIKKLVREFKDVNFIIFPNSGKYFGEKNATCIEWVENMEDIYKQVRAIIRLPLHDGLSNTILEALSMGRMVIASETVIPYCKIVQNYDEIKNYLKEILDDSYVINKEASKYIHQKFNNEKILDEIISIYQKI